MLDQQRIDEVVFAYSDVSYDYIDEHRQAVEARGVAFNTFDVDASMLETSKPVIAVTAVRTGCGKSQVSRRITDILRDLGLRTVAIRHPMPYGDLARQKVQRFASYADLVEQECTIEEREEYEPHIANGVVVYAGEDYAAILEEAAKEAEGAAEDAKKHVAVYDDYKKLLEDSNVEAVIIALPLHLHAAAACKAMKAGKHVYSAVPSAASVEELGELVRTEIGRASCRERV